MKTKGKELTDKEVESFMNKTYGKGCLPPMITPYQAVALTGLNYQLILQIIKSGKVGHVISGQRYKINRDQLRDYLFSSGMATEAEA